MSNPFDSQRYEWSSIRDYYGTFPRDLMFKDIYARQLWGTSKAKAKFFSGPGSEDRFSEPYTAWLLGFMLREGYKAVVDLGCGDFRVGAKLCLDPSINYVGVDIVPSLVQYNERFFSRPGVRFECLDLITDPLPRGQIACLRQVLQHLSNTEISRLIENCRHYEVIVVTEDIYAGVNVKPNRDMLHGPTNRLFLKSGVFLELPPFSFKMRHVLEVSSPETCSVLRTSILRKNSITVSREKPSTR